MSEEASREPAGGEARARYVEAMFARIVPRYDLMNALMSLGQDRPLAGG